MASETHLSEEFAGKKWMAGLCEAANGDDFFIQAMLGLAGRVLLDMEIEKHLLEFRDSRMHIRNLRPDSSWDLLFRAPCAVWRLLFSVQPPPGRQGITALSAVCPDFRMEGDQLLAAQALHAMERLVELGRGHTAPEVSLDPTVRRDPGQVSGRYVDLPGLDGSTQRIYYESAGKGLPLVLLHTAGADTRQFHELLCDVEIAAKWHMLAFDLPMHGKSIPSPGWWRKPYRLTTHDYAHFCSAFIRVVVGQRAVVMGCSMGGAMAVYLAAHHRDDVAAAVCLEVPDRAPGRINRFLCNARVNQAAHNPAYVYNLMSPLSPLEARRRAWWYYSQGGFGVYAGDLHFYSNEWDAGLVSGKTDANDCPIVMLTGEYDYSASPESTERLAEQIPGAQVHIMSGLGHFPMTENPDRFRTHLLSVLDALSEKLSGAAC